MANMWLFRPGLMTTLTILLTVTFFAKSAVIPFYMWPAKAHAEAPDDFSAFLSGIMIKYGVFGMITIVLPMFAGYAGPAFAGVPLMLVITGWIGALTAVIGTLYAIAQNDMKKLMAYSTVGNIGYIIAALSVNSPLGIAAALFHTMNHMVFKSGIFLSMAAVKYRTGEREMHKLGGMAYNMPIAFFTFLLCIISAAGIPPMSGFGSKWLMLQSLFEKRFLFMTIPIFFASTGAFMYLFRGLHTIYLGQLSPRFAKIKASPPLQMVSQIVLMLLVFLVGLLPGIVLNPINRALTEMGKETIASDMFGIVGNTSTMNLTVAGLAFMGAFGIVMVLFLVGRKRQVIKESLDRYTSAEIPEEWDLTPEKYHFGYNFYDYFTDWIIPVLNALSFDRLFKRIAWEIERFSAVLRRFFSHPLAGTMFVIVSIITLFCVGWYAL
jgi:NADH-quinone oxidoreductase subunit M